MVIPLPNDMDDAGDSDELTVNTVGDGSGDVSNERAMIDYQLRRNPGDAFEALINLLLDQKIFFVQGFTSQVSESPMVDPFGLVGPHGEADAGTQVGWPSLDPRESAHGEYARMVEINSAEGTEIMLEAWRKETGQEEAGDLTDAEIERFENWKMANFAGNDYMYLLHGMGQGEVKEDIAIVPSYDGGVMGNLSTIEEALRAVPLDKSAMDRFTFNMSRADPRKWRAVQSVMSTMGFYGDTLPQVIWGGHSHVDRNAFKWMMQEIMNEELKVAQHNRTNPTAPLPKPTLRSFVDRRYSDYLGESVRQANASADGLAAFGGDVSAHIESKIADSLSYLGQSVTPSMQNRINTMVNEMFIEGDLDAASILNTDLVGMQTSDDDLKRADAWLAAFHGNQEGWEDNIEFGINGTPTELLRIAKGAGVDLTGVNVHGHRGTIRELGPDGEMRDAASAGEFSPISGMTTEQRHNVARWYFLTLQRQNNNDLSATANQYANTIGNRVFERSGFDNAWLDKTVGLANQDPTSFAYKQGWETYEEQSQERIDALNNVEARIMASEEFSNISNKAGQKALGAVLSSLGGPTKQRRRRL